MELRHGYAMTWTNGYINSKKLGTKLDKLTHVIKKKTTNSFGIRIREQWCSVTYVFKIQELNTKHKLSNNQESKIMTKQL